MTQSHMCVRQFGPNKHCCRCLDCARFERDPSNCQRCGKRDESIGWNSVCGDCADAMGLTGI